MTSEQQNIAIAESQGWLSVSYSDTYRCIIGVTDDDDTCFDYKIVPNYTQDLNAIHAAIHAKTEQIGATSFFYDELETIIGRDLGFNIKVKDNLGFSGHIAHATALQLCESYLKTLGLWTE